MIPTTQTAIASAQTMLQFIDDEALIAGLIEHEDPRVAKLDTFAKQNILRTQVIAKVWRRLGRQTLAMHPEIVDEVKVSSSDRIPGEALRVLPYMNPMVVFADPPVFNSWVDPPAASSIYPEQELTRMRTEEKMRLLGFFCFGSATVTTLPDGTEVDSFGEIPDELPPETKVRGEQRFYNTADPRATRFGMLLVFESLDAAGTVIDIEFNSMTVPYANVGTFQEVVDDLMGRFHWDNTMGGNQTHAESKRWLREVMATVVGTVFYLCSTSLEAEKVPASATRHLAHTIARKPLSLYRVGWTTGAALSRLRQQRKPGWEPSQQGDLRHQRDPEHRRGHFKMQPYGPRNALRKLIWVSPYWTHLERLGEVGMNTVHKVPRIGGKGEARQSTRVALELR